MMRHDHCMPKWPASTSFSLENSTWKPICQVACQVDLGMQHVNCLETSYCRWTFCYISRTLVCNIKTHKPLPFHTPPNVHSSSSGMYFFFFFFLFLLHAHVLIFSHETIQRPKSNWNLQRKSTERTPHYSVRGSKENFWS